MIDSPKCAKQSNKTEIEELFNRENSIDESKDIKRTNPRHESKREINKINPTNRTVQIERLKFELLFNKTHKKEPPTAILTRLNNIDKVNDKERPNNFDRYIRSNKIDIVKDDIERPNDFDRDSLDRIPSLNIDKDSLGDNIDTDSLDEIETDSLNNNNGKDNPNRIEDIEESLDKSDTDDSLNNNKGKPKHLIQNKVLDIVESASFDNKSDIDGDIFVNSSNIDKSESEIYDDILKTIQNSTVKNSDTEEIFEDTLNTVEDILNNNLNDKLKFRPNSDDEFELSVNELSVKESRAVLASEIQNSCYSYDKFDRFFSAIDFFEESPSMQRDTTIRSTKKDKTEGGLGGGYQKKKIPILSNTIARNERRKISYLEQYKKKCSKKLKKVMKDTETKTVENSCSSRAASVVCSVSSKNSFGNFSNGEIEDNQGKGDHVGDDEQCYYDAITKYEQLDIDSAMSNGAYETCEDGSIVQSKSRILKSYNGDERNNPSKKSIPKSYNPNGTNTSESNIGNIPINLGNSNHSNMINKLDSLHKKDSTMSTTNNSMNDVKTNNMNKVARNVVNEGSCKSGNNMRKSERFDTEAMQNVNPMQKRAHSVQNGGSRRAVHMIASQKSMPIYRSQVQHMTSSKTNLQNFTTNQQLTIEQNNMNETDSNIESQYSSQNLMSTYPTSVQNIAKVYPLARVFPHRQTNQIHAVRTKPKIPRQTCQPISNQKPMTMPCPSHQEHCRNRSNQIQKDTSGTGRASLTKNQPTKSTSSILIRNTVKEVSQQDLNRNTNSKQKVEPTAFSKTISITKQQPVKSNSSILILSQKLSTRSNVRENIQAFEQKSQKDETNLKQNIDKELIVETMKTSQQCFPKSRQDSYVEISKSKVQQSRTEVWNNAQEKSKVCLLPPRQQSQKSFTKVSQKESVGKLEGKQESQKKSPMQQKSQLEVSKTHSNCQQNALKSVPSNQYGITRSQKSSQQELTTFKKMSSQEIANIHKLSLQKIIKSPQDSEQDVSKSAPSGQQEIGSSPRSEDTDSVSVHTQTLSDKGTQFEEIYQDSLNVETIYPKIEQKRPATTSDNRQRMPQPVRHLSSKPRKSYVELYQQKMVISRKIPVPISKLNLKPRKVEEKLEVKKSTPGEGGENKEEQRKEKVIPKIVNDSAKAGGEGNKVTTVKQTLPRYNLKKKIPTKEELTKPEKVIAGTKSKPAKSTQKPVEEDQDDLRLKLLDEKREQLQKQLSTIKSKPRAAVLHYK